MPRSRLRAVVDALRELFDYAADLNLIRVNPATYVSAPAEERPARRRLAETIETRAARPRGERGERSEPSAFGDSMISERVIWMCVKIVTLIFICIALVLVAESV
jgi:site-specific recombinase XerC